MASPIASTGVGEGLLAIASGIMGIALIGMIISKSDQASELISTGGQTFGNLLQIATFQNSVSYGRGR